MTNSKNMTDPWLSWAVEIQSLAQNGLTYAKDAYDIERYERLRELSAEMLSYQSDLPVEKVTNIFCNEQGYQTPKIDTRAVMFHNHKILLVQERDGTWALPGGWADVLESVKSNTEKEAKEETGLDVTAKKVIAIHDRNQHNKPIYAYGIWKIFVLCEIKGGKFHKNIETLGYDFFDLDHLPSLSEDKTTKEQVEMCFRAHHSDTWDVEFD